MRVLVINRIDAHCGACGRPARPDELAHLTGAGHHPQPGCGAEWTHLSTNYTGTGVEASVRDMRPDLTWIGVSLY